jgi:hypothetical protein
MWTSTALETLDFTGKGLHNISLEPRDKSDLWLRGSATLDGPMELRCLEEAPSSSTTSSPDSSVTAERGHTSSRRAYPLRVKFEVALAVQPECEYRSVADSVAFRHHQQLVRSDRSDVPSNQFADVFFAACLRHHYKTWNALAADRVLARRGYLSGWRPMEAVTTEAVWG